MVTTGRKTMKDSRGEYAIATGFTSGSRSTVVAAGPRLGAEQMEQEWCEVCESASECECTACAVPIANTSTMDNRPRALTMELRFDGTCIMVL